MRTRNASTAMPTARPRAIGLIDESPSGTNAANTANMITAAAVTTRAEAVNPVRTAPTAMSRPLRVACAPAARRACT